MLLGFIVLERGIEAILEKIAAIECLGLIKNLKRAKRVTGCLAALNRFISRLGEHVLPLYKLLKKSDHFTWTDDTQVALDKIKGILTNPSTPGEPLLL